MEELGKQIHVRLSKDMIKKIDIFSKQSGMNYNNIIRVALIDYLKNHMG